jgi:hypothetical protein
MRYYLRPSKNGAHLCEGCGVRLTVGEPSAKIGPDGERYWSWTDRLEMSEHQIRYCTEAAAEFDELTEEAGLPRMTALEFIDWLSPSARGRYVPPPQTSGIAKQRQIESAARDPFPLPIQSNGARHTRGRRATA